MPTINQLSAVTSLSTGDNIVIQSAANNDARKASLSVLLAFIEANFASPEFTTEINAPTSSGFNLQMVATTDNMWMIINPTGAFAAGTLTLPPVDDCFDGQQIVVTCSAAITAFTVAGNGATVTGAPTSLGTGGFFALRFNALQDTWYCVSQSLGSTDVFTSVTITTAILDANGNEILKFTPEAAAVNEITVFNGATGNEVGFAATGGDANIDVSVITKGNGNINLNPAGTGVVLADGDEVITQLAAQVIQNKSYDTPSILSHGLFEPLTFAAIPAAAVGLRGARAFITDGAVTLAVGVAGDTTVLGGGANIVPIFCNGTNWKYG
jgi:hypothetical protein